MELNGGEILAALEQAQALSVQGGRVYDYAHAVGAIKAHADAILTRNVSHFTGLTGSTKVEWP